MLLFSENGMGIFCNMNQTWISTLIFQKSKDRPQKVRLFRDTSFTLLERCVWLFDCVIVLWSMFSLLKFKYKYQNTIHNVRSLKLLPFVCHKNNYRTKQSALYSLKQTGEIFVLLNCKSQAVLNIVFKNQSRWKFKTDLMDIEGSVILPFC